MLTRFQLCTFLEPVISNLESGSERKIDFFNTRRPLTVSNTESIEIKI
jgi:hypothetical protein